MVYSIYRPWTQPRVTNIINNNIYPCCDNRSGGRMDNTGWYIFGGGVILSMLSGIFGGGRQQSYAPGWDYASHNRYQNPTRDKQTPDSLDLNSLKELYGDKWKIVERDGTFTAVHKETGEQKTADSYSNMLKELGGKSTSTTGQVTVNQGDPMTKELAEILIDAHGIEDKLSINNEGKLVYKDKDTGEEKTCELTEQNFGAILNAIKKDVTPKNDPTGDPDAEAIQAFNDNPAVKAKNATIAKNGDKYVVTIKDTNGNVTDTKEYDSIESAYVALGLTKDGKVKQGGGGSGTGFAGMPKLEQSSLKWQRVTDKAAYEGKTATEISKALKAKGINVTADQIIDANPSVFDKETGQIRKDAKWDKLDLPTLDKTKQMTVRMNYDSVVGTATIVTADGKVYRYTRPDNTVALTGEGNERAEKKFWQDAANALAAQAKADGWTNLTIGKKASPNSDEIIHLASTGKKGNNSNIDKTGPYTVRYTFAGGMGQKNEQGQNQGVITVTLPDGTLVKVQDYCNDANDLMSKLQAEITKKGWTNITIAKLEGDTAVEAGSTADKSGKSNIVTSKNNSAVTYYEKGGKAYHSGQIVFGGDEQTTSGPTTTSSTTGGSYTYTSTKYYTTAKVRLVDKDGYDYTYEVKISGQGEKARKKAIEELKTKILSEGKFNNSIVILNNPSGVGGSIQDRTFDFTAS